MSGFERGQGEGFYPSSNKNMEATQAAPFADGYVSQGRGIFRGALVTAIGMPVAGAPVVMIVRDGPTGPILHKIPMYGVASVSTPLFIPWNLENGLYVTGLAALVGTQVVTMAAVHECSEPGLQPQAEPR